MVAAVNKPKFYMSRTDVGLSNLFNFCNFERVQEVYDADLVVFGGGADINPFLYGEKRNPSTYVDYEADQADIKTLRQCGDYQSKVGVCRGGQFLNVMVGNGTLWQHVTDHGIGGVHAAKKIYEDKTYDFLPAMLDVTSTHHQMMRPGETGEVVYAANRALSKENEKNVITYEKDKRPDKWDDAEVVFYPDRLTCCWQPHPEYNTVGNYGNKEAFIQFVCDKLLLYKFHEDVYCKFYENFSHMKTA